MRKYLKDLSPNAFEDLIAMVSLYRPGPLAYIPTYIERKYGREELKYMTDDLIANLTEAGYSEEEIAEEKTETDSNKVLFRRDEKFKVLSEKDCKEGLEERKQRLGIPDKICYWEAMTRLYESKCENLNEIQIRQIFEKKAYYRKINNQDWPSLEIEGDYCVQVVYDCEKWSDNKETTFGYFTFEPRVIQINPYIKPSNYDNSKKAVEYTLLHEGLHSVQLGIEKSQDLRLFSELDSENLEVSDFLKEKGFENFEDYMNKLNSFVGAKITPICSSLLDKGATDFEIIDCVENIDNIIESLYIGDSTDIEDNYEKFNKDLFSLYKKYDTDITADKKSDLDNFEEKIITGMTYVILSKEKYLSYLNTLVELDPRLSEVNRWWLDRTAPNCEIIETSDRAKTILGLFLSDPYMSSEYLATQRQLQEIMKFAKEKNIEEEIYTKLASRIPGLARGDSQGDGTAFA